jgi:hypothetical protein
MAACLVKTYIKYILENKRICTKNANKVPSGIDAKSGEHLVMEYRCIRGSDWTKNDINVKIVTSFDGNRLYLFIIDWATKCIWIFITKTKYPPVSQVEQFLKQFRGLHHNDTFMTDLGRELAKSIAFRKGINETEYTLHKNGADSSAQNGIVEKPNQDLAQIMRGMLYSFDLGSQYWLYVLQHHAMCLRHEIVINQLYQN